MNNKENKGGFLKNEEIEKDRKVKGVSEAPDGYHGTQDTGDERVRQMGNEVQKRDGASVEDDGEQ